MKHQRESSRVRSGPYRKSKLFTGDAPSDIAHLIVDNRFTLAAEQLLKRNVIGISVAGTYRSGDTNWHSDNLDLNYIGIKFLIYLDDLSASNGALRVIPGSHRNPMRNKGGLTCMTEEEFGVSGAELPAHALATQRGDVIAFSHRLWHASFFGRPYRRMIELNYYADPRDSELESFRRQMCMNHHAAEAMGVKMYPSDWRTSDNKQRRMWVNRLAELRVLDFTAASQL